ncbi:hypothetical protein MESS2_1010029 [Mesorhizobium metallidurans STM 2683]|uniref:Uncharacterized protein n=1 Tax=Mesorhizobium metallidurans STM 2683 TaxID=1297569 RepID=M5EFY5_9HYPH|nr:hypothetical protein MESS2_1010029 [Mesorhizobium metallidurans STM 2683]
MTSHPAAGGGPLIRTVATLLQSSDYPKLRGRGGLVQPDTYSSIDTSQRSFLLIRLSCSGWSTMCRHRKQSPYFGCPLYHAGHQRRLVRFREPFQNKRLYDRS